MKLTISFHRHSDLVWEHMMFEYSLPWYNAVFCFLCDSTLLLNLMSDFLNSTLVMLQFGGASPQPAASAAIPPHCWRQKIDNFYITMDKHLIPCQATPSGHVMNFLKHILCLICLMMMDLSIYTHPCRQRCITLMWEKWRSHPEWKNWEPVSSALTLWVRSSNNVDLFHVSESLSQQSAADFTFESWTWLLSWTQVQIVLFSARL